MLEEHEIMLEKLNKKVSYIKSCYGTDFVMIDFSLEGNDKITWDAWCQTIAAINAHSVLKLDQEAVVHILEVYIFGEKNPRWIDVFYVDVDKEVRSIGYSVKMEKIEDCDIEDYYLITV